MELDNVFNTIDSAVVFGSTMDLQGLKIIKYVKLNLKFYHVFTKLRCL